MGTQLWLVGPQLGWWAPIVAGGAQLWLVGPQMPTLGQWGLVAQIVDRKAPQGKCAEYSFRHRP